MTEDYFRGILAGIFLSLVIAGILTVAYRMGKDSVRGKKSPAFLGAGLAFYIVLPCPK